MTQNQKIKIQETAKLYADRFSSQNSAGRSLEGTSTATFTQVLNGKWEKIADEMWLKISRQVGHQESEWNHVNTTTYLKAVEHLDKARNQRKVVAFNGLGGIGKTHSIKKYVSEHAHVIWLKCESFWTQKYMLDNILRKLGEDPRFGSIAEKVDRVVSLIKRKEDVLIIFDQFNRLGKGCQNLFIPLYNYTEGFCGFAFSGTNHFKKMMKRGVSYDKDGAQEIMSRMNRVIHDLPEFTHKDVVQMAYANGLENQKEINRIWKTCESTGKYDLRFVKDQITDKTSINHQKTAA